MKKHRRTAVIAAAALAGMILLTMGVSFSYLIDKDVKENVITIGNVSLEIDEGAYTDTDIVSQSLIPKAPSVKNTGNKNEYVFMRVRVPKKKVTLLYETDTETTDPITNETKQHYTGEIISTETDKTKQPRNTELFKMLTIDPGSTAVTKDGSIVNFDTSDVVFYFHEGVSEDPTAEPPVSFKSGWLLLSSQSTENYDEYVFCYNKLLKPNDMSATLFDRVMLKSFIDEEITGKVDIDIRAYGIQSSNLNIAGLNDDTEQLSRTQADAVYSIIKNKRVMQNEN